METFAQLESYSNELVAAVKSLKISTFQGTDADSLIDSEVHSKADQAKQTILSNIAKIKILIHGPTDFLKHLAVQVCGTSLPKFSESLEANELIY